ncbi:MAG: NAD(P)-dependent oxidoreductase [Planctomycetes bacterium]|nr:NAD(P)-dependent oxidoreductase [Planctomycetota bacterium]
MSTALIGHTGFVGQNLASQRAFGDCFNSRNISSICGRSYDLVVCCGVRAEKWKANQEPAADWAGIQALIECLQTVEAQQFILISTVDIYAAPVDVDEDSPPDLERATPYGRHRYWLEQWVEERFPTLTVRLPGLFGPGLKKNVVYDLVHGHCLEQIHSDARYQFYGLEHVWRDIETARRAGLRRINIATEPVSVEEVARGVFGLEFRQAPHDRPARYDFRSRHAAIYGGNGGYLYTKAAVLDCMRQFVCDHRGQG